jgi:IS30 family transposase
MAHGQRTGLCKFARNPTLAAHVIDRLQAAWSLEPIAGGCRWSLRARATSRMRWSTHPSTAHVARRSDCIPLSAYGPPPPTNLASPQAAGPHNSA